VAAGGCGRASADWESHLPVFKEGKVATRNASGKVMTRFAAGVPGLIGGSADLEPSTKTFLNDYDAIAPGNYGGRNLHFGVREHAMGGIANGMAVYARLIPYTATFLVFSDYMRPAIRLAALSEFPTVFVFTHDSIGLGEDGPTHQPVEHIMSLRLIPHLDVIRPADANETARAWRCAIRNREHPTALLFTRQNVPVLTGDAQAMWDGVERGAYVVSEAEGGDPAVILIGTGSEVHLALAAQKLLAEKNVAARVVSMPSWERFERQPQTTVETCCRAAVTAVAVEAGSRSLGEMGRGAGRGSSAGSLRRVGALRDDLPGAWAAPESDRRARAGARRAVLNPSQNAKASRGAGSRAVPRRFFAWCWRRRRVRRIIWPVI